MSSNRVSSTGSMDHQSTSSSTTEPVELHQQVSELQAALEAQTRENALLNEVISTVCSTLKLDEVLRHLVDTIIRAISCHAAFIYLYEKEKDRLVLASTSAFLAQRRESAIDARGTHGPIESRQSGIAA